MQPVEAQKGVSSKGPLFDSLKEYLNKKNRLQPIIGLHSIIECVKTGTHNREALYLCEVCVCRLSKADVRNHITGSLHRYNYIKARHPHLVSEWKENSDLSKLAWPLMEKAKIIEGSEGPGDVQLLEVDEAVYQEMATRCENYAVILINILREGQGQGEPHSHSETASVQLEHYSTEPQRIVLVSQNQPRQIKQSLKASAETLKPQLLMRSTIAPTEGWFNSMPESLLDDTSENSSFLDGYTGAKPLIGLFRVVECRSEDGHTYCFLCHCCRIRSNKKDIIDHITSSSHLINYLMETHSEQVEVMMADINDNYQLLQSKAKEVEQEEGRGELKVVNAPESLCILMAGKSYHWCIKMLYHGEMHTNKKREKGGKEPRVNKTSHQGVPEKCAVVLRKRGKRMTRKKMRKVSHPVFKVSLPLPKGLMLLERTSFSVDSLPVSTAYSPPYDSVSLSPECQLDYDNGSFAFKQAEHTSVCTTSQLQRDLSSGDEDTGQYMGPEQDFAAHCQEEDCYFSDNDHSNDSEYLTWTKDQCFHGKKNYSKRSGSQETLSERGCRQRQNEDPQRQNEWLSPAVSHTQDLSSYKQWYNSQSKLSIRVEASRDERQKEVSFDAAQYENQQRPPNRYTAHDHQNEGPQGQNKWQLPAGSHTQDWSSYEQWYNSQSKVRTKVEVSRNDRQKGMSSDATQYDYPQQLLDQVAVRDHTRLLTGSVGQQGVFAPCLNADWTNMHLHLGDYLTHSSNTAPDPRVQFLLAEQQWQKYVEFTTGCVPMAPQRFMMHPMTYQATQLGHGVMSNPNYNTGPTTNPDQSLPHPAVIWNPCRS